MVTILVLMAVIVLLVLFWEIWASLFVYTFQLLLIGAIAFGIYYSVIAS